MMNSAPAAYRKGVIDASFCIGEAWELVKRRPLLYIGASLLVMLINMIPYVGFILFGAMMGGFAYIVINDIRNQPVSFVMTFKGFERFIKLMVVGLIQAIPAIVLQLFQAAMSFAELFRLPSSSDSTFFQEPADLLGFGPGITVAFVLVMIGYWLFLIFWNWVLLFAIPLIVEFDAGIGEAISLSFGAAFNNVGGIIILGLYSFLVALIGMIALCIGIFVAIPVVWAAQVIAYRQVFPSDFGDEFAGTGRIDDSSIFGLNN
jgi:hypothetical protein